MGCNMFLKISFLHSHLYFYPPILGVASDEHWKKFRPDISTMKKKCRKVITEHFSWLLLEHYWKLSVAGYKKMSYRESF
jgi:hypothetical protein